MFSLLFYSINDPAWRQYYNLDDSSCKRNRSKNVELQVGTMTKMTITITKAFGCLPCPGSMDIV